MAVPRLEQIATRLRMARHEAVVEDRLGESPPVVRLAVRPWHAPLSRDPRPPWARLDVTRPEVSDDVVVIRTWLDSSGEPEGEEGIAVSHLRPERLERVILEFVGRLLRMG